MFGCDCMNASATFLWLATSFGSPQKPQVIVTCSPPAAGAAVGCSAAAGAAVGCSAGASALVAAPPAAGALVAAPPDGVVAPPPHADSAISAITSRANTCPNRCLCMGTLLV